MKLTVELEPGETPAEADELILKAILTKQALQDELRERYDDPALNEFHDLITTQHLKVIEDLQWNIDRQIKSLIERKI